MTLERCIFICFWAASAQGCAWMAEMEASRRLAASLADDSACRDAGYEWPAEAYVDCRRFRYDDRLREQWQEMQLLTRDQRPEPGITPLEPREPYRPVREDNFACREAATPEGVAYVDCGELRRQD